MIRVDFFYFCRKRLITSPSSKPGTIGKASKGTIGKNVRSKLGSQEKNRAERLDKVTAELNLPIKMMRQQRIREKTAQINPTPLKTTKKADNTSPKPKIDLKSSR